MGVEGATCPLRYRLGGTGAFRPFQPSAAIGRGRGREGEKRPYNDASGRRGRVATWHGKWLASAWRFPVVHLVGSREGVSVRSWLFLPTTHCSPCREPVQNCYVLGRDSQTTGISYKVQRRLQPHRESAVLNGGSPVTPLAGMSRKNLTASGRPGLPTNKPAYQRFRFGGTFRPESLARMLDFLSRTSHTGGVKIVPSFLGDANDSNVILTFARPRFSAVGFVVMGVFA